MFKRCKKHNAIVLQRDTVDVNPDGSARKGPLYCWVCREVADAVPVDEQIGRAIRRQQREEQDLRLRIEELNWVIEQADRGCVDDAMDYPNEVFDKVEARIKVLEAQLEMARYYGD